RGCPIETEMRPNSMALFGRMKYNYRFWIELFHIDCRNYPSKGAGFAAEQRFFLFSVGRFYHFTATVHFVKIF
ncbi:MAG: hypothetical protein OSJ73_24695, partial [Lachnospiraceae bacterium]|nr:hypothetical protein [Lachnospiraceae bacterium]